MQTCLLFFIASVVGGAINAIAGGGGLITFPLLMLVGGPLTADATSAVAGFASYPTALWRTRSLLRGVIGAGWLWLLLIPSAAGGRKRRRGVKAGFWFNAMVGCHREHLCRGVVWRLFRGRYWHFDDRRVD